MLNFEKNGIKNICLIGMMGSGKSIIGKEISKIYNIEFYDSDLEIEKKTDIKINKIFEKFGENYFRNVEEEICEKLLKKENCVISLGGGSICSKKIRNLIKKYSYSIYLKVNTDILLKRLNNSVKRPLLNNVNKKNKLEEIFINRKNYYNSANLIIENNFDKKNIIAKIKKNLSLK